MKRKIIFRGKDLKTGEWRYGDLEIGRKTKIVRIHTYHEDGEYCQQYIVDENTVGQFTGLKDNDDKEIYEGDIIRFMYEDYSEYNINGYHHPVEVISAVTFEWGSYMIDGYPCRLGACCDWAEDECEFEVIGNIYDNPDLIKKE